MSALSRLVPSANQRNGRVQNSVEVLQHSPSSLNSANRTKSLEELTLKDRLSQLTMDQVKKLLGSQTQTLLIEGGSRGLSPADNVYLSDDLFRLTIPGTRRRAEAIVTISLKASARERLQWRCTSCSKPCDHVGAAFSMILENKVDLGLAVPPPDGEVVKLETDEQLVEQALSDRQKRAETESMTIKSLDPSIPWTDYSVTSKSSGKVYRVALRGTEPGDSYCSCPDFRSNTLGTCKHILHVLEKVRRKLGQKTLAIPYEHQTIAVALHYGPDLELRVLLPKKLNAESESIIGKQRDKAVKDVRDLVKRIDKLDRIGVQVTIYPDAEEFIQQELFERHISDDIAEIRRDPAKHALRNELLKTELLPYQLDGIAFAVGAGRSILADEMGLGKTIQGVGVAELLARTAGIKKVLVVCPASLKSQWRAEIERFSNQSAQLILGTSANRLNQYANDAFFTICNYEQVLRDFLDIEKSNWDLIILDEAQRIKNWEAKTTRVIKALKSRFALVLTGTPLENRIDDLFSIVQFIDDRRLGPGFRFFHRHRIVADNGRVRGYKNLNDLRKTLEPVLLRRTRESVKQQLPGRVDEIVRIAPTEEQKLLSDTHLQAVSRIASKKFLTEMDLIALRRELMICRMAANSTQLVDKQSPGFSSKLERLDELIESLFAADDRKAVIFSEWTSMLDLIEPLFKKRKLGFVRLDGSVPQKNRPALVSQFQNDVACRALLATNAGSTGLNLQAANTVINVDLPWNPAVLEQRIARAYRMGQKRSVQVYVLVTEQTLEERLLATLAGKHELARAALDQASDVDEIQLESSIDSLKRKLEILLGAKPDANVDQSEQQQVAKEIRTQSQQQRLSLAGGQLLTSAVAFLEELAPRQPESESTRQMADSLTAGIGQLIERDANGTAKLSITLPNDDIVGQFAAVLSRFLTR